MKLIIPSRGRYNDLRASTLSHIPVGLMSDTVLWVHSEEFDLYLAKAEADIPELLEAGLTIIHSEYSYIGEKRYQIGYWAERNHHDFFCMLDDDVDFLIRKDAEDWPLRAATGHEAEFMFDNIRHWLERGYSQVAISPREGNNRMGVGSPRSCVAENTRAMRITAYKTKDFMSVEHNRVPVMEDFDVLLQLLRAGKKNLVLGYWANGQKMTNAPGGCSLWRTRELHNRAAEELARLHPGFVRIRQKENKTDKDGLGTRKEVTVQWKRAFASSQS